MVFWPVFGFCSRRHLSKPSGADRTSLTNQEPRITARCVLWQTCMVKNIIAIRMYIAQWYVRLIGETRARCLQVSVHDGDSLCPVVLGASRGIKVNRMHARAVPASLERVGLQRVDEIVKLVGRGVGRVHNLLRLVDRRTRSSHSRVRIRRRDTRTAVHRVRLEASRQRRPTCQLKFRYRVCNGTACERENSKEKNTQ